MPSPSFSQQPKKVEPQRPERQVVPRFRARICRQCRQPLLPAGSLVRWSSISRLRRTHMSFIRREGVMQLKNKLREKFRVDLEKSVQQFALGILWQHTCGLPTIETSRHTGNTIPKQGRSRMRRTSDDQLNCAKQCFQSSRHVGSCEMRTWRC